MRISLLAKPEATHTGIGRYAEMLAQGLPALGGVVTRHAPILPPLPGAAYRGLRGLGLDLAAFLTTYPLWARWPPAEIHHLASQNLAAALWLRRPRGRVVVTVHDIIPFLVRDQPALSSYRTAADRAFDRLALGGLRRAAALICVSHYTRQSLVDQLGLDPARLTVVYLGIDHQHFRPQPPDDAIYERYDLQPGRPYVIYVGSEDPRKNLPALLQALALLRETLPAAELLKVGRAHSAPERARLQSLASDLGIAGAIRWLDDVPEADLPPLYSLAAACVLPSWYEGFGFPVLEAMACGTPVIAAATSSLVEIVGSAGLTFDPHAPAELAAQLAAILAAPEQAAELRARGLAHAASFTWERTMRATWACYERTLP